MSKIRMVCEKCGSSEVSRDASVFWNVKMQRWEVAAVFDNGCCENCMDECNIIAEEL